MNKRNCEKKQSQANCKYPSAEFVYSIALEDYNRILANYDKIYDRINIALTLCSALLVLFLSNINISCLFDWTKYTRLEKITIALYVGCIIASSSLMIVSAIKFLLLVRSKRLPVFDSNCIKEQELYEEKVEDSSLWVTLQYIRITNTIRTIIEQKQNSYNQAVLLIIISILMYVLSVIISKGGLI